MSWHVAKLAQRISNELQGIPAGAATPRDMKRDMAPRRGEDGRAACRLNFFAKSEPARNIWEASHLRFTAANHPCERMRVSSCSNCVKSQRAAFSLA